MATERQIEANRRNAKFSTGPQSAKGKAKSAANAMKHGLTSQQVVLPYESATEFEDFAARLREAYAPRNAAQEEIVSAIVTRAWRRRRGALFEAALHRRAKHEATIDKYAREVRKHSRVTVELERLGGPASKEYEEAEAKYNAAANEMENEPGFDATRTLEKYGQQLENTARYEDRNERAMLRLTEHLQLLQMVGERKPIAALAVVDVDGAVDTDSAAASAPVTEASVERVDEAPTSKGEKED